MARQAISVNAVFVGLCALVPVPFLDDLLRRLLMRGAYQAIAEGGGQRLEPATLDVLTQGKGLSVLGCALGLAWSLFKKLSKKILYFLSVKDALDWAAEAAVRGEMVRLALARGLLPEQAARVKQAMDRAWTQHGGSPVTRTLLWRRHDALDWRADEGALVPLVGDLARRGAAAAVLAAFVVELDRPAAAPDAAAPDAAAPDAAAPDAAAPASPSPEAGAGGAEGPPGAGEGTDGPG